MATVYATPLTLEVPLRTVAAASLSLAAPLVFETTFVFTSRSATLSGITTSLTLEVPLRTAVKAKTTMLGEGLHLDVPIRTSVATNLQLVAHLLERTPVRRSLELYVPLDQSFSTLNLTYGVRVLLDGEDVTDKVLRVGVAYSMDNYCGELRIQWADRKMFSQLDSTKPEYYKLERLEVFTKQSSENWVSQGRFLVEKRSASVDASGIAFETWGRSRTALLADPFAAPIAYTWGTPDNADVWYAKDIAESMAALESVPLSWEVYNFPILPFKLSSSAEMPIDIISKLAAVVGGIVTTTKSGTLRVMYRYGAA